MNRKLKQFTYICLAIMILLLLSGFTPAGRIYSSGDPPLVRITQVDTSRFPQVVVYVSVTDAAGEPVEVAPSQFVLAENGVQIAPQQITGVGETDTPLTTLLVMDVSGSMNSAGKLEAAKEAAKAYVKQSRPNDQIGVLVFNTKITYLQLITQNRDKLIKTINAIKAGDDTAMYDALVRATEILSGQTGRKAIIALTDGMDNRSKHTPDEVIQRIGPTGLSISTIGLGDPTHSRGSLAGLDEAALVSLSEQAGGVYGYAKDADALRALYERYGRALQSEYALTYATPSTLRDGVNRALSVSLKGSQASPAIVAADYNPGGLVPEVAKPASWIVFLVLLVVLLVLLALPVLVARFWPRVRRVASGRIKLDPKTTRVKIKE
jgi:Ca-activated chloride channel family protein